MHHRKGTRKGGSGTRPKSSAETSSLSLTTSATERRISEYVVPEEHTGYKCTGNFEEDFAFLCHQKDMVYVPQVVPRARGKPAGLLSTDKVSESKRSQAGKRAYKKATVVVKISGKIRIDSFTGSVIVSPHQSNENMIRAKPSEAGITESDAFVPTTFKLKDKLQFFKPCVQVEFSETEEPGTVTEIYVRGWKVDVTIMEILQQCCPALKHLHLLHLWNVGLTAETLDMLLSFLPKCPSLTSLTLDANPLSGTNASLLIDARKSHLEELSLRFCELNDINAYGIGAALGTTKTWNKKLLSLNLANNKIGDAGVRHIANGLKTNRTLLTLNLANNQIGNEGAATLAEVLSQFALNQEQIMERRSRLSERDKAITHNILRKAVAASTLHADGSDVKSIKSKQRAVKAEEREKKEEKDKKEKERITKKRRSIASSKSEKAETERHSKMCEMASRKISRRDSSGFQSAEKRLRSRDRDSCSGLKFVVSGQELPIPEWHPLMEVGSLYKDGQLWVLGNRSLVSLNLSRNQICETGLRQLLDMVQVQAMPCHEQQQTGTGLKRLVVNRNAVAMDNATLQALNKLMVTKDPMYRMPFVGLDRTNVPPCAMPPITI